MRGEFAISADIGFKDGDWTFDDEEADYIDEFRDAVETVRDDHDEEVLVQADGPYNLRVRWNDKTDEVRFDVYGLSRTYVLVDGGDD